MPVFGFNTDIRYGDTVYHVQTEAHETEQTVQTAIFVRGRCVDKQQCSYSQEASAPGFSEANVHQLLTRQHKFVVSCIREGKLQSLSSMGLAAHMSSPAPAMNSMSAPPRAVAEPLLPVSPSSPAVAYPTSAPLSAAPPQQSPEEDVLGMGSEIGSEQIWSQPIPSTMVQRDAEPAPAPPPLAPPAAGELKLEWLSAESVFTGENVTLKYRLTVGPRGIEGAKIVARLEIGGVPSGYARTVTDANGEAVVSFKLSAAAQSSTALSITVQAAHAGQSAARRFRLSRT